MTNKAGGTTSHLFHYNYTIAMSYLYNTLPDAFEEQLETEHLVLRPYAEGDEQEFMRLIQENTAALSPAFTGRVARVRALEDARIQLAQLRSDWDNRKQFDFGVWLRESNTYIGDITLKNIDRSVPKAEAALYFTSWSEMLDLAQEAFKAVLHFAFEDVKLNKVYMRCTHYNNVCSQLAENCGFVKEGVLRSDFKGADSEELLDLRYYGMTRDDYEQATQLKERDSQTAV
ncbi:MULTISPECIES: GNAT family N-acetyltransferase [Pontibacter]|uniref:Protein N-acetyltransferase, RimJ/RimL family n=1 Tax=Pontibacter lucknowensis TaxID=1077936 RepID=A0A1N6TQF9_9BACT|nr:MULTISPECIES: GNAT family protein [Pontibacter]EJF09311.1 N-acetyltransferase GCN5 [Pontibacter sp. BAB1700]SIQ55589.1 Protein N-acetyltransferase, RimJ/RimL family [Pontibacter lucknowensis]